VERLDEIWDEQDIGTNVSNDASATSSRDVFIAFEPLSNRRHTIPTMRRERAEFAQIIKLVSNEM
jgi:hypothetical protein